MNKYLIYIITTFFFIIGCDKEENTDDYDSANLLGQSFISTNNNPLNVLWPSRGGKEIFKDTTWYDFSNSNQLVVKSHLFFFEKPSIKEIVPYPLQNQDTLYLAYLRTIMDYVIENQNSIKFTSEQIKFPEGLTASYEALRNLNSMQIIEFNDSFLKAQFEYTIISTGKDSTYTHLLKPIND